MTPAPAPADRAGQIISHLARAAGLARDEVSACLDNGMPAAAPRYVEVLTHTLDALTCAMRADLRLEP